MSVTLASRRLPAGDHRVILQFMEITIKKINTCQDNLYAIKKILIDRGIATEKEFADLIREAKLFPQRMVGIQALKDMIKNYKGD